MAESIKVGNGADSIINHVENRLFEVQCLIKTTGIHRAARCEIGRRQLLAFTTKHTDIGLFYQSDIDELPIIKRIPWFPAPTRAISALCFDPTGSWLLTASADGALYIVPVLALIDDHHVTDNKWSTSDITPISLVDRDMCYSRPSALTWWQGVTQCSYIAIIGTEDGEIILINLENGQWIGSTSVPGSVAKLEICLDSNLEIVSLLVTSKTQHQWRLILEQRTNNSIFNQNNDQSYPSFQFRSYDNSSDEPKIVYPPVRSRLQGLKQLSVEKLAVLKQKLAETRNRNGPCPIARCDSASNGSASFEDSTGPETPKAVPRFRDSLLPLEALSEDMFLSPQYTRQGQHLYTAYCKSTNHVTIHGTDASVIPLHMYKMPDICKDILLTQRFFFVIGPRRRSLCIISCPLCEVKIDDTSQFNPEALIGKFQFGDSTEVINNIYRVTDFMSESKDASAKHQTKANNKVQLGPVDTCLVVTNYGVYKVVLQSPLLNIFIELALKGKSGIEKAVRLATIFGMDILELFETVGDIHLSNGRFTEAANLYKLSRCRLLKGVLKTAATGHTSKLLDCLTHCLTPPAVSELTTTMRIHLSNLTVFAFSELILRASPQEANGLYKNFLSFLSRNIFYDERWVVDIVGQTCLWKVLHHLTTHRGLCIQVLDVLIKTVESYNTSGAPIGSLQTNYGLLICISEPNLVQAMLTMPHLATNHMKFVICNLSIFQVFILERLVTLYDPTHPAFRQHLIRYWSRRRTTSHSSQSSQCDSLDAADILEENGWRIVEELIETFLLTLLTLISKTRTPKHNPEVVGRSLLPNIEKRCTEMSNNVDFKRRLLVAGYGHVALIRNGNVYTWGNSSYGCLGTGPSISRYGSPQAVTVFRNMAIQVLSVSCGRSHTLAVTSNGVYTWGASQFGQLGLVKVLQTPNPELIVSLAQEIVVDAVAGQYHSVALTMDGRVFTWGWGVHGQLGHGNTYNKNVPTVVTSLVGKVIRVIAAGHAHTLVLSAEGDVYAFGCNIFGQLGTGDNIKSSSPVKITLLSEPICDIATGYFHNLVVSSTNKLYTWGSSPQVLRLQTQAQKKSKLLEFQAAAAKYSESLAEYESGGEVNPDGDEGSSNINLSLMEKLAVKTINERNLNYPNVPKSISLRDVNLGLLEEAQSHLKPVLVDTSLVNGRIIQISTGCHHSALLTKDGTVYCWGRNLDGQIGNGTRRDVNIPTPLTYNPVSVLGHVPPRSSSRVPTESQIQSEASSKHDAKINRVIKAVRVCCGCEYTVAIQPGGTVLAWGSNSVAQLGRPPTKESGNVGEKLVLIKSSKRMVRLPHGAHVAMDTPSQVPNIPTPIITYQSYDVTPLAGRIRPLSFVENSYDERTLHYALEQFIGLYDTCKIMDKCDELANYQAYSKIALLEHNIPAALGYQLKSLDVGKYANFNEADTRPSQKIKENTELFVKQVEKNFAEDLVSSESKKKVKMPASKSLDSILVLNDQELHTFDCQGGSEGLCDDTKSEDLSLDLTEDALDNDIEADNPQLIREDSGLTDVVSDALGIIDFYVNEVDDNSHDVLRRILQTVFDFWIKANLPMEELEKLLLKYINKLFYALGLFIFCQSERMDDADANKNDPDAHQLSTVHNHVTAKFCLQVCSSIFRRLDEGKASSNFVELFSSLTAMHYGPSPSEYPGFMDTDSTPQQMMKGIINTISSRAVDSQPFIHIKDPEKVSQLLELEEDVIVFTCGHYFPISIYQSEVIPNMEAELLMAQPRLLPGTAQVLENMLTQLHKLEIVCPQCIPRAIQGAIINLMDK